MEKQKYLSDYVSSLNCGEADALRKPSFLYLAEQVGIETGCEFSYHHNSITCGQTTSVPSMPLSKEHATKLDVLAEQETQVLDVLCTIVRFSNLGYTGERLREVTAKLKKHSESRLDHALTLARQTLHIDVARPDAMAVRSMASKVLIDLPPGLATIRN